MGTAENPHAGQGMGVLDIGGDIGALVLAMPPELDGAEIEICPAGRRIDLPDDGASWWQGDWRTSHDHHDHHAHRSTGDGAAPPGGSAHRSPPAWPHVAVLRRPGTRDDQHAAVFPGLRAGTYEVWSDPTARST